MDYKKCFAILTLICAVSFVNAKTEKAVERPLLVGAFNIENLGQSKMSNKTVMDIVHQILLRYDLVLIQEIVTMEEELMENLVKDLNKLHKVKGSKYMLQISERLGRGNAKEQYGYLYRSDKFSFLAAHTYPDKKDDFMRPPYIAHFATPTLRDMDSMIVIGVHTQPKNAANETSSLAQVYDYAKKTFKVKDAIIMGDMNIGCGNVRISDWNNIEIWQRKEFTWLITHDMDTTQSITCCPYDRIIIAGDNMMDAVIYDSVAVFKFRDAYEISSELALAVSDHWPVEVKLKGSTSTQAKKNIKPSLCMIVQDERKMNLPTQFKTQKTTLGFSIESTEAATELYADSEDQADLLLSFQKLQSKYPLLISSETMQTVSYKLEHGALHDASSYDDVEKYLFYVFIRFDATEETTEVQFCTSTTIN